MRASRMCVAATTAGMLLASSGIALACEDALHAVAPGGGSASALQRAGLAPNGVAASAAAWTRVPPKTTAATPVVALDARSLRAGLHAAPLQLADTN